MFVAIAYTSTRNTAWRELESKILCMVRYKEDDTYSRGIITDYALTSIQSLHRDMLSIKASQLPELEIWYSKSVFLSE